VSRLTAAVDTHAYEGDVIPNVTDQLVWAHSSDSTAALRSAKVWGR
jgi:hypothetical protein